MRLDARNLQKKPLGLDRGQRLGRFVEHENLGLQRERLGDLDELSLGDGEVADPDARVELGADRRKLLVEPTLCCSVRRSGESRARSREGSRRP